MTGPAPGRASWRKARPWIGLALVLAAGGALVAAFTASPARPLDPNSTDPDGSRALVRVLTDYGVAVRTSTTLAAATRGSTPRAVVVTAPDDYSDTQLRGLRDEVARVVLVRPGTRAVAALAPDVQPGRDDGGAPAPGCTDTGAVAAGRVALPPDAVPYTGAPGFVRCYDGVLLTSPRLAVLGSAQLLHNRRLADAGVAALDVNAITGSRALTSVVWLEAGSDANGSGPATIGALFPPGATRALWWLVAVAVLLVLWRARRLGGVVLEPLPVVVRAAEVVEGHGRLYRRAGARDRAAAALRRAGTDRLRSTLGLPRGADADQVAGVAAHLLARPAADLHAVLAGPVPVDDAGLVRLAERLDELEAAVHAAAARGNLRKERA